MRKKSFTLFFIQGYPCHPIAFHVTWCYPGKLQVIAIAKESLSSAILLKELRIQRIPASVKYDQRDYWLSSENDFEVLLEPVECKVPYYNLQSLKLEESVIMKADSLQCSEKMSSDKLFQQPHQWDGKLKQVFDDHKIASVN